MEFGRYVVISTGHVSHATSLWLNARSSDTSLLPPLTIAATPHGWFLSTRKVPRGALADLPAELIAIQQFGMRHGCAYVLLDSDADSVEELTTFNW